jgi:hypothetical protein
MGTLSDMLDGYSRDRLKETCRTLGLEDGGRDTVLARLVQHFSKVTRVRQNRARAGGAGEESSWPGAP